MFKAKKMEHNELRQHQFPSYIYIKFLLEFGICFGTVFHSLFSNCLCIVLQSVINEHQKVYLIRK